ncbi:MAG TPA: hypothetical protein VJU61_19120, partial [Polyangiaceae bacterium]|nr:hypothetical protein [Polyangiaceae bacterium]
CPELVDTKIVESVGMREVLLDGAFLRGRAAWVATVEVNNSLNSNTLAWVDDVQPVPVGEGPIFTPAGDGDADHRPHSWAHLLYSVTSE